MEGQAFLGNRLEVIRLNDLARLVLDADLGAVEVRQHEVDAGEGLNERDFLFAEQIGTLPLELLVGLFLHDNDDIARLDARCLVSLTMECVLGFVRSTLVDHHV